MYDKQRGSQRDDELSRALRALRAAGLDQVPAAEAAGIGQASLSRAEHGHGVLQTPDYMAAVSASAARARPTWRCAWPSGHVAATCSTSRNGSGP